MADSDQDDLEEELLAVAGRGGNKKRGRASKESDKELEKKPKKRTVKARAEPVQMEEESESEFDDGYGSDLMGDEEDRARLMGMTELEREMELAERAEARDKDLERRQTRRMLKQQQKKTAQASNMRSSTRQRGTDMAKKSAMAELVAAKNARARKAKEEERSRRRERDAEEEEVSDVSEYEVSDRSGQRRSEEAGLSSLDQQAADYSELESEGDDEVMTRQPADEDAEEAEYQNIKEAQVRRFQLEKWVNEPFFERSLPGAVVRLAVGHNRYFMAQIVHVEDRDPGTYKDPGIFRMQSPYEFPDKASKTHKWLYVQRGTSPRFMPMTLVSNHGITEDEYRSWQTQCDKDNRPQVSIAEVDEVKQNLKNAATYVYTAEDVTKMVEEKRSRGEVKNFAKEKSRLVVRRAKALEDGDTEALEALEAQIAELEVRAGLREQKERVGRDSDKGKKSLAEVNKANALRNVENALRNVGSRPEGTGTLTADGVDVFSRRQTRPMNYWSTKRNAAAIGGEAAPSQASQAEAVPADTEDNAPTATATENEAGGIDLNIDLTALHKSPAQALLVRRLLGPNWAGNLPSRQDFGGRKTLTFADYKRRQGIA